ncbi:alpha-farnesene synthase isoform X4 [Solanum lycopersicum]|uniref:alpha-farnesene synthase isoform X4 n=1 Tax=Solanum lycopersicum TaxID=4081 RepID=UPI000E1D97BF|nr:alpha-farnesene synthase isoform X4 [Solanum lycopersicum]
MACINMVSIASTMQTQKLHSTTEKDSQPERISTYKPNIWKYDHLLSLTNQYSEAKYKIEAEKLKEEVGCMFSNTTSPVAQLQLIDGIDKLGLSAYFEVDTKETLENIILYMKTSSTSKDLYATALCFRLLREHGYHASQDMLKDLFDGKGKLPLDMKTSLELFEGSHLSIDGENLLNDIRLFSTKNLKNLSLDVDRLTSNPLAWRVRWYDVRKHIITAQNCNDTNPMLLKLAKLNFNIIQATHQKDLKDVIRWWRNVSIIENLEFTRERIVESFFFAVGIASEGEHGSMRKWLAKVIQLILIIDDVYDIYGTLADVQQFTVAIEKWDPEEVQRLPKSIQICFGALHDTMEDISVEIQRQKGGPSVLPHLKQVVELERGDVASSIICYMHQENVSEDVAREHIESIILNSWEKTNYHFNRLSTSHRKIMKHVINEARMAHVMYLSGDGFGVQDGETQDQVLINLVQSII